MKKYFLVCVIIIAIIRKCEGQRSILGDILSGAKEISSKVQDAIQGAAHGFNFDIHAQAGPNPLHSRPGYQPHSPAPPHGSPHHGPPPHGPPHHGPPHHGPPHHGPPHHGPPHHGPPESETIVVVIQEQSPNNNEQGPQHNTPNNGYGPIPNNYHRPGNGYKPPQSNGFNGYQNGNQNNNYYGKPKPGYGNYNNQKPNIYENPNPNGNSNVNNYDSQKPNEYENPNNYENTNSNNYGNQNKHPTLNPNPNNYGANNNHGQDQKPHEKPTMESPAGPNYGTIHEPPKESGEKPTNYSPVTEGNNYKESTKKPENEDKPFFVPLNPNQYVYGGDKIEINAPKRETNENKPVTEEEDEAYPIDVRLGDKKL